MATSKSDELPSSSQHYYTAVPVHDENYVVLPYFYPQTPWGRCRIICTVSLFMLGALVYVFWPSRPSLEIVRMHVNRMNIHTKPVIAIDISLFLTLQVSNADVYSMDYTSLDVSVGYRGKVLGHVRSDQGHVMAHGSSYVDAELEFDGVKVFSDVVYLLEDLAKGTVPFDTVTEITGQLGLYFFQFPLKAKLACEVLVDTINHTIARQNCYPKE